MNGIEEAVDSLCNLMSCGQPYVLEQMSRSGKGELFILQYLNRRDAPATPSEISDVMCISTARISAALNSLEKKGQICREIDMANRRNILVTITDEGRERICSVMSRMKEQLAGILTEMGEPNAADFARLTKQFFEIGRRVFENGAPF